MYFNRSSSSSSSSCENNDNNNDNKHAIFFPYSVDMKTLDYQLNRFH